MEEHPKFMNIVSVRARTIERILDLWSMRNIKAIISILKEYTQGNSAQRFM